MAYSTAKLRSNGDKASPCFKPFQIANMSDSCLPIWNLLYVSFTYFYYPYQFHGNISLNKNIIQDFPPKWTISFLKSINSWRTAWLYSHFFLSIWHMQNIWSVVDLLHQNQCWWSPIISSAYGVNLESRMLDKILYVVGKSDMRLQLLQSVLSPFLYIDTMINSFQSSGNSSLFR